MKRFLVLLIALAAVSGPATSQTKKEQRIAAIEAAIQSKSYTFRAQTALSASGRSRQLNSLYTFTVAGDSVISDLPYFGRAYVAPVNPTQSVLRFNSARFSYTATDRKKGGWDIMIKLNDVSEVQNLTLSVSREGYGTLQVTPTNRQIITFNGSVEPRDSNGSE